MKIDPVQEQYASLLLWLVRIGLVLMFAAFTAYIADVIPANLKPDQVVSLWHLSASEFAEATGAHLGWAWVASLPESSVLALAALVVFPLGTMLLIAIATILYLRERDRAFAAIAAAEAIVLTIAATGLIGGGH